MSATKPNPRADAKRRGQAKDALGVTPRAATADGGAAVDHHEREINREIVEKLLLRLAKQPGLLRRIAEHPAEFLVDERFRSLSEMSIVTGWHRSTVLRNECLGKIPRRVELGNGQTAFRASEVRDWIAGLKRVRLPKAKKRSVTKADFPKNATTRDFRATGDLSDV